MLNREGRCYSFDNRGDGYGRGEGAGVVVLKRLADAIRNNDSIRAVICDTAVNFDGRTNGVTLPNTDAQHQLLRSVYGTFDPSETGYFEAHGTGTVAGDIAEFNAISKLFDRGSKGSQPLMMGSVKSNIGHLGAASGVAGLIKTVLVLEKGQIPPNPEFLAPKQGINLETQGILV